MREVLDYGPEPQLSEIHTHLREQSNGDLIDKLWDYLNFFEFVAGLLELKQITSEDLELLFDYPLRRIANDEQIMGRLGEEGYEHLDALLRATFSADRP